MPQRKESRNKSSQVRGVMPKGEAEAVMPFLSHAGRFGVYPNLVEHRVAEHHKSTPYASRAVKIRL